MKFGASVTKARLDTAARDVQNELSRMGLLNEGSRLIRTEVFWCWLPQITMPSALGFFVHETTLIDSVLGYEAGHMYIPQWVLSHGPWQRRGSLRDVVRHEYGHAVAHHYPSLIRRSSRFASTFGGRYGDSEPGWGDALDFVTDYAATCPAEDFAETFMLFLRHRGKLPESFFSPAVREKWQFVEDLSAAIDSGAKKW